MSAVVCVTTRRRDGNARTPAILQSILRSRRAPRILATAEQVHGSRVAVVPRLQHSKTYPQVDGLLTAEPGQALGIFTADCAPVFLSHPGRGVIGMLHAGWRGAKADIVRTALRMARRRWGCRPKDIHLQIGPCIGPCCFEVQWDVARYFPRERRRRGGRWTVDLAGAIRNRARRQGIPAAQIQVDGSCSTHTGTYFSFRRDQSTERQISITYQKETA